MPLKDMETKLVVQYTKSKAEAASWVQYLTIQSLDSTTL